MELSVGTEDETVHYYTRVIYGTSFHLKECLDFAQEFHNATLDEGNSNLSVSIWRPKKERQATT